MKFFLSSVQKFVKKVDLVWTCFPKDVAQVVDPWALFLDEADAGSDPAVCFLSIHHTLYGAAEREMYSIVFS